MASGPGALKRCHNCHDILSTQRPVISSFSLFHHVTNSKEVAMKPPPRGLPAIVLVMVTAQLHQGVELDWPVSLSESWQPASYPACLTIVKE